MYSNLIWRSPGLVPLALLTILVGVGLELWIPQLLAQFIDDAFGTASLDSLIRLAAIYIVAAVVAQ